MDQHLLSRSCIYRCRRKESPYECKCIDPIASHMKGTPTAKNATNSKSKIEATLRDIKTFINTKAPILRSPSHRPSP